MPSWLPPLLTGLVAWLVYLRTACRTVYVGDSGELAAAVHTLGVAHPPGYPLYVLAGKLFSRLVPVGRPVLRLNLFSTTMAAVSVGFLHSTLTALGMSWPIAASAALTWAASHSLWSQSGIARVYALGAALSAAATCFAVRWYVDPLAGNLPLFISFAIVGLGMANHTVAGAHLPALAVMILLAEPSRGSEPLFWLKCIACVAPGLALYAWIPLRARRNPQVNWGNIRSTRDLIDFFRRKQYWQHRYVHSPRDGFRVVVFYLRCVVDEFGFLGAAAIVVGLPRLIEQHFPIAAMVGALVVMNAAAMIAHARREDIFHWTRYMLTAWLALCLPLAGGWAWMLSGCPEELQPWLAFLLPSGLFLWRFSAHDLSRHRYAEEYNRRILDHLPEHATLIAQDDNVVFPLMYLKYAEGVRPDVALLEQGVHQLAPLKFNPRREAVYCTHWNAAFNQPVLPGQVGLRLVPEGVIYRVVSTDMAYQPRDLWDTTMLVDIEDPSIPRNYLTRCLLGHMYFMRGEWAARQGDADAIGWYQRATRMAHDDATLHYNVALAYRRAGWQLAADDFFARAAQLDRKFAPPASEPESKV